MRSNAWFQAFERIPVLDREYSFTFSDLMVILKKRRRIIIGAALLLGIAFTIFGLASYPVYEARGLLQIASQGPTLTLPTDFLSLGGASSQINSETEIIKSRSIAQTVIDKLGLSVEVYDDTHGGPVTRAILYIFADWLQRNLRSLQIESATFPADSYDIDFYLTVTDENEGFSVRGPSGDLGSGRMGDAFQSQPLSFTAVAIKGPVGSKFRLRPREPFETMKTYNEKLTVSMPGAAGKSSNLIQVVYESLNPEKAAKVVNSIIDEYESRNTAWKLQQNNATTDTIQNQLDTIQTSLVEAEQSLEKYQSSHGVIGLPEEAQVAVTEFAKREAERVDLNMRISVLQNIQKTLASQINSDTFSLPPALTQDPVIAQLAQEHASLMVELNNLLLQYEEKHPSVESKRQQIVSIRENILEVINATVTGLVGQRSKMDSLIGQLDQKLYSIPGVERELLEKSRTRDVADEAYRLLMTRKSQAELLEAGITVGNRIVDNAVPPTKSIAPNIKNNAGIGLLVGLILGLFLALLLEVFDPRLRKPEDIKGLLGGAPLETVQQGTPDEISHAASALALAAMKNETGMLSLVGPALHSQSSKANLEKVIARLSQSLLPLLLVDASPFESDSSFFSVSNSPGLSEIASGHSVQPVKSGEVNILVLPQGSTPSSAHISSQMVHDSVTALSKNTALTLFYAPGQASEPAMRGWNIMAGGAVLILQRDHENKNDVIRIMEALESDKVPILGALLLD
jgi:uncharacterized protein involved in exopolysaccharide biosynthesis